jgi:hypothetical protein
VAGSQAIAPIACSASHRSRSRPGTAMVAAGTAQMSMPPSRLIADPVRSSLSRSNPTDGRPDEGPSAVEPAGSVDVMDAEPTLPPEPPGGTGPATGAENPSGRSGSAVADGPANAPTSGPDDEPSGDGRGESEGPSGGSDGLNEGRGGCEPDGPGVGSDGSEAEGVGSVTVGVDEGVGLAVGVGRGVGRGVGAGVGGGVGAGVGGGVGAGVGGGVGAGVGGGAVRVNVTDVDADQASPSQTR